MNKTWTCNIRKWQHITLIIWLFNPEKQLTAHCHCHHLHQDCCCHCCSHHFHCLLSVLLGWSWLATKLCHILVLLHNHPAVLQHNVHKKPSPPVSPCQALHWQVFPHLKFWMLFLFCNFHFTRSYTSLTGLYWQWYGQIHMIWWFLSLASWSSFYYFVLFLKGSTCWFWF